MTGIEIEIDRKLFAAVGDAPPRLIYDQFRLSVAPGAFVCILGPSGAGKTTLLNMVAGLDTDFAGRIVLTEAREARIGYAFQSPRLLPWRTVLDNVLLPLAAGEAARRNALALLDEMGLSEALDVYPERLSLGMQRRVALARAFAVEPDLLLMDEPFVSLDEATADRLRDLLALTLAKHPSTVLFVTHDSREAVRLADRVVIISGSPAQIVRDVTVSLGRQERRDGRAVDAFRVRHLLANIEQSDPGRQSQGVDVDSSGTSQFVVAGLQPANQAAAAFGMSGRKDVHD
jgi:ABC-type nitrate/sulfonate/bicarbonate transport system ATPase subunit